MSKVDLQTPKQDYIVNDSISINQNQHMTDSILDSKDTVSSKELESISMFSSLAENDSVLGIGATVLGTGAVVFAAKKFGLGKALMTKIFPEIEGSGFKYRKFLGKKLNIRLSNAEYKPTELADNSLIGQRIKNPHPTNLHNELERCKYSDWELELLLRKNPNLSRTVGSLPSSWIKVVNGKGENPAEIQQRVDSVLSKYASEFHAVEEGSCPSIKPVQEELSNILGTEVRIQNLGGGKIGYAYKISAHGEDFVYKVYHNQPMMGFVNHGGHGNYPELLSAIQAKKNCPNKFAEFYLGKFGERDDGYILTKFIPETETAAAETKNSSFKFSNYLQRMISGDPSPDNIRNGITLDYGLTGFSSFSKLSPKAQKMARELFPILDGKSPEKIAKVVQKYQGKQEFEEVRNFISYIIENKYINQPEFFASKKSHLVQLGFDFKPDIRKLFQKNNMLDPYANHYGISVKELQELREKYRALKKS